MEQHKKAIILHGLSGTLWLSIAACGAYITLMGLSIPTVVEDFTNQLLLYSGAYIFFGYHIIIGAINYATKRFKKVSLHYHLRKIARRTDED